MNKDEIIAMARDANPEHDLTAMLPFLSRFAALVEARERAACAQVCEGFKQGNSATYIDDDWADMCAAAIRAKGNQPSAAAHSTTPAASAAQASATSLLI